MKTTIIISLLWLILTTAIFYTILLVNLHFNLFSWHHRTDELVYVFLFSLVALIIAYYYLAKYTRGVFEIWFSFLIGVGMMIFGLFVLYDFYTETISTGIFSRTVYSPHWFRIFIFTMYLVPIITWFLYPNKMRKKLHTN